MRRIPVGDHALAQTLWACMGASESVSSPGSMARLWDSPQGERLRLRIVNFLYILVVVESR